MCLVTKLEVIIEIRSPFWSQSKYLVFQSQGSKVFSKIVELIPSKFLKHVLAEELCLAERCTFSYQNRAHSGTLTVVGNERNGRVTKAECIYHDQIDVLIARRVI